LVLVVVTGMSYKISLVDRNPTFLDLTKFVLESNSYCVKTSLSCSLAKELAEIWKPNLIILDSNIADIKASRFIDEIQGSSSIPILLFASLDNHLNTLECLNAGATDCIYKPVSFPELLAKVNAFEQGLVLPINQFREINSFHTHSVTHE
jgi:DNA-binding response OmpR family regulator